MMEEAAATEQNVVSAVSAPLNQAKTWIKVVGVVSILEGVLMAITLFGLVIAWLPIWLGVMLFQVATNIEKANASSDQAALMLAMDKLRLFFTILGIFSIVAIVLGILASVFGLFTALFSSFGTM